MSRRLPLFILVDNSMSTIGQPISRVNDFIDSLVKESKFEPCFFETLHIALIEFGGNQPKAITGIETLYELIVPKIQPSSDKRYLGKALDILIDKVNKELVPTTKQLKGDWKYSLLIFLFGESEDEYQTQVVRLRKLNPKPNQIFLIGLNSDLLAKYNFITSNIYTFENIDIRQILKSISFWNDDEIVDWDD